MVTRIKRLYESWEENFNIGFVGSGRAFCSGSDVVTLHQLLNEGNVEECKHYFQTLNKFVYLLGTYLKPHVAILDGLTMGSGAGISFPGMFRVVTDRTMYSLKRIRIAGFRLPPDLGIQNWIKDLYWKQLDSNYPGMPDAMVHHGFYSAYHNTTVRPAVVNAVQRARELYGDIDVMVTGHLMGGAMAAFCGLDLVVNFGIQNVQVVTFGQPRIGIAAFASCYNQFVPHTIRITHDHDIVPHLPPYFSYFWRKTYHHTPRELKPSSPVAVKQEKIAAK